jgi:hypothetical protein
MDELELLTTVLALEVLASVLDDVPPPVEELLVASVSSSPSLRTPATSWQLAASRTTAPPASAPTCDRRIRRCPSA